MTGIVDAHHHIWRQTDLPWLLGPTQPRIFGPYDAIKRDYLIEDYLKDIQKSGVIKSVYVQANWAPNWFVDEVAWVQSVADRTGWPHGIVGYCDMTQKDARFDLDKLAKYPLLRGIRQQFHWHENPQYRFAPSPDLARSEAVQRNVGFLKDYDLTFDLQVFPSQMEGAVDLANACSNTTLILQHAGMLEDRSSEGLTEWRTGMRGLARQKNVLVKLSGLGTFLHRNDRKHIAAIVGQSVKLFGAKRCLFGSNFPIEKLWTSYPKLLGAFKAATGELSAGQQKAIFHDTASRAYRL